MDQITTAITAALAAGAAQGSPQVITRSYDTLKTILKTKFGPDSELIKAIDNLEAKPDSPGRRVVLKEELAAAGAAQDPKITAVAQALLDKIRAQPDGEGQIDTARGGQPVAGAGPASDAAQPARSSPLPLQRPPRAEPFIGRRAEVADLLAALQPGRAVGLYGPGGVGKSSLAAEIVWTLAPGDVPPDPFPDGIIYHNFYNQPQLNLALEQIVRACGDEAGPTLSEAVRQTLNRRQMLLVLDGVEQASEWPQILLEPHAGAVLLTARQSQTGGRTERYDIAPLPLDEAASLLRAWSSHGALDEAAARQICQLVGGLPLAVRLAGAYLAARPDQAADFLAWLQESPLAGLEQDQRHRESVPLLLEHTLSQVSQTARQALAVIGSLALVPFAAEVIAEALAIGVGRTFRAAIAQLLKPNSDPEPTTQKFSEVRAVLDELVHYGLLQTVGQGYELRPVLLHTYIRQRMPSSAAALERLVTYYTNQVGEQILLGLDNYATLDIERPHLMHILTVCAEQGNWEAAHALAAAIEDYLDLRGYRTERVIANETGLAAAQKLGRRHNENAWLGNLGLAYQELGHLERAIGYYEQALEIAGQIGDRRSEANSLGKLGLAYRDLGQKQRARQYLTQALAIFDEINSPSAEVVQDWLAEFEEM